MANADKTSASPKPTIKASASLKDAIFYFLIPTQRKAVQQVGLLDENFFMYGEDIDWCYRMKQAGWVIYYYPKTGIVHYKGASSRKKPFKIICEFYRAMYLFHRKHYSRKYSFPVNFVIYLGIGIKFIIELIKNRIHNMS